MMGGMSYACLLVHAVLVCDGRRPLLTPETRVRLYPFLGSVLQQRGAALLAANGMSDHVHVLLSLGRTHAMAEIMREMKSVSSRWMRGELGQRGFGWQSEYAAFSVSPSARSQVERYIANQEQHHRKFDLRQEMLALLKAHGLEPSAADPWLGASALGAAGSGDIAAPPGAQARRAGEE